MTLTILLGRALALGLSAGLYCAGFCFPLLGPVVLSEGRAARHPAGRIALFLAGRLLAYLLFGLIFGMLGSTLGRIGAVKTWLLPTGYCLLGIGMVAFGLVQSFPHVGLCGRLKPGLQSGWYVVALGFLAGINLCPPFLLAVTTVIEMGGPLRGLLFFLVFFLATSVYLLPLLFAGLVGRFASVRFAARVLAVLTGGYYIFMAIRLIV